MTPEQHVARVVKQTYDYLPPYFSLFRGKKIAMSQIEWEAPVTVNAVNTLLDDGKLVGQYFFDRQGKIDQLIWMPDRLDLANDDEKYYLK